MKHIADMSNEVDYIITILKSYGASKISLFGSYARGDNRLDSDIDVLVDFKETITLIDLAYIIRMVKEETGLRLDLVTKKAISPYLAPYIEKDLQVIYSS
jgi:predicted nucleotidyltransferase